MTDTDKFHLYYVNRLQTLGVGYRAEEFVNPHNPLWPQQSFDYPYGQAPEVDDLPPQELADWDKYVATHYLKSAIGADEKGQTMADAAGGYVTTLLKTNALRVYPDLPDDTFRSMLCEGLFSKFLCALDPGDYDYFGLPDKTDGSYLKCDVSCMHAVDPWKSKDGKYLEYVAPAIAVVQRAKDTTTGKWKFDDDAAGYTLVGIYIWDQNDFGHLVKPSDADQEHWRRAKYFVLQGAIHRMNLIDHVKVHFPHDTINAVTKSVLPKWHFLHQLLIPHFWLTLPVNNSVLEGDRSLINRDTWYPWSPFAGKGDSVRRLLPYSWGGNEYYYGVPNNAFPPYQFNRDPFADPKYPNGGGESAWLIPSRYVQYMSQYYSVILDFVRKALANGLPPVPTGPDTTEQVWLEIKRWAHEIARFLPNFPDETGICDLEVLSKVVTVVIWNASVVHSFDHGALHTLMNDPTKPMPFVMRVPYDDKFDTVGNTLGSAKPLFEKMVAILFDVASDLLPLAAKIAGPQLTATTIEGANLTASTTPLCGPADVLYAQLTDLLFYRPHNSSLLYDCHYAFDKPAPGSPIPPNPFPAPLTSAQIDAIDAARTAFKTALYDLSKTMQPPPSAGPSVAGRLGLPRAIPLTPSDGGPSNQADVDDVRVHACIAAGIQY